MKYQNLINKINIFYKIANGQLDVPLSQALKNNDRDSFLIFLDALEEETPKARAELEEVQKSVFPVNATLMVLSKICPKVVKEINDFTFSFSNWSDFIGVQFIRSPKNYWIMYPDFNVSVTPRTLIVQPKNGSFVYGGEVITDITYNLTNGAIHLSASGVRISLQDLATIQDRDTSIVTSYLDKCRVKADEDLRNLIKLIEIPTSRGE